MKINVIGGEISPNEINEYIKFGKQKYRGKQINQIDITLGRRICKSEILL